MYYNILKVIFAANSRKKYGIWYSFELRKKGSFYYDGYYIKNYWVCCFVVGGVCATIDKRQFLMISWLWNIFWITMRWRGFCPEICLALCAPSGSFFQALFPLHETNHCIKNLGNFYSILLFNGQSFFASEILTTAKWFTVRASYTCHLLPSELVSRRYSDVCSIIRGRHFNWEQSKSETVSCPIAFSFLFFDLETIL